MRIRDRIADRLGAWADALRPSYPHLSMDERHALVVAHNKLLSQVLEYGSRTNTAARLDSSSVEGA